MNLDSDQTDVKANVLMVRREITISRWVNEPLPAWDQVLTAHDVARLLRRPPWLLCGMALLRRFPKKRRFHGLKMGWLKSDVVDWTHRGTHDDATGANEPFAQPYSDAGPSSS
jgi:hypothetical protein